MGSGDPLIHQDSIPGYVIDVAESDLVRARQAYPRVMALLSERVLPQRERQAAKEAERNREMLAKRPNGKAITAYQDFLDRAWWKHWRRREDMVEKIGALDRYIALTIVAAHGRQSIYEFVESGIRPDASLQVFALDDDYSFGILS